MPALPELQAAFAAALDDEDATEVAAMVRANRLEPQRRVGIYRNNTRLTQAEALAGIYPGIERLLGEEFFGHMADLYATLYPSRSGDLRRFGGDLAEFLEGFEPTAALAYLPDVARLEWAWHEAFHAPFSDALARLPRCERGTPRLALRPGASLLASAYPAARIWEFALSDHAADAERLDLEREAPGHTLVFRPQLEVLVLDLEPAEWRWLHALHAGVSLPEADAHARALAPAAQTERFLRTHLEIGTFSA